MGKEIKIIDVQAENGGTLIQVDFATEDSSARMFIPIKDILRALNNYLQLAQDDVMLKQGFELEDPENYKNPNLL